MLNIFKKVNKKLYEYGMDLAIITEDMDVESCDIEFTVYSFKFTIQESANSKNKFCIYKYDSNEDSLNGIENVTKSEISLIAEDYISDLYMINNRA